MVGTFQEILDSSSGNWVRIKSITDLRVLSFVGSSKPKYSSTELNFGCLRERGWRIFLRSMSIHDFRAARLGFGFGLFWPLRLSATAARIRSFKAASSTL